MHASCSLSSKKDVCAHMLPNLSCHVIVVMLFFLYDAVRQCLPVFVLLSFEDQSLLVGMNTFLDFTLTIMSLAFDIERNRLASQRLDVDLHVTIQPTGTRLASAITGLDAACVTVGA